MSVPFFANLPIGSATGKTISIFCLFGQQMAHFDAPSAANLVVSTFLSDSSFLLLY
jgi:hypothetical protein